MAVLAWLLQGLFFTLMWPLNIPLMALAYKVRHGRKPIPYRWIELWVRCGVASLLLALMGGFVFMAPQAVWTISASNLLTWLLAVFFFVGYVLASTGCLLRAFQYQSALQAFALFVLYVLVPGVPVLLVTGLFGWY